MTSLALAAGMTRKRGFWAAYAAVSMVALIVAALLFPQAIPLLHLDIKLDRGEAIKRAQAINAKLHLAPADARTAVRFSGDQTLQNYVELEGGGKAAFATLIDSSAYSPLWWEVRLFKPGVVDEVTVRFRPDGSAYGFTRELPETFAPEERTHLALDSDAARQIGETRAREDWAVDFGSYTLIERTQQQRTNGRVDHSFVYRRTKDDDIGAAHFRLRLEVDGDVLAAVERQAQVPEAFTRRFAELRSANNTLASAASLAAALVYGVGGCILGVLWLLRRHWLLWRPALAAGFVVATLLAATSLAKVPSAWFGFDTAQSVDTFWTRQIGSALLILVGGTLGYGLAFMAAESLSRRAFGEHPQLWRLWSRAAAPTWQVLGRTLGGYLFVPFELAFVAVFYYATNRWLGWGQPSQPLTDPNILGSAVPALGPIALSLQAGFMEECLFRAVPLALGALVGARFGQRTLGIAIAVVFQALVFAGAHANYPGLPSYSRLVELTVPAIVWALVFLRYGLLPTIIFHALFDLALFAIPLFLVDASGANLQRALVIGAGLVPLAIVAVRRAIAGSFRELAAELRNRSWEPGSGPVESAAHVAHGGAALLTESIVAIQRALPVLAAVGLIAWLTCTPWRADVPPLPQTRIAAELQAEAALKARGVELGPEWRRSAAPKLALTDDTQAQWHEFVWREAGSTIYARLIGQTLAPPLWEVRYARFEGTVAERTEEWRVTVNGDGTPRSVRHTLPEDRVGAKLDRDAALALAETEIRRRFGEDPSALTLVGAEEKQRTGRADWTFSFADPRVDVGKGGQARLLVEVLGDEIGVSGRFVHVPEDWQRAERERSGKLTLAKFAVGALFGLTALAALIGAVIQWTRHQYDPRAMRIVAAITLVLSLVSVANHWPVVAMSLTTAEPIAAQAAIAVAALVLMAVLVALICGFAAGVGAWAAQQQIVVTRADALPAWAVGAGALLISAGVGALVQSFTPASAPRWPSYDIEASWQPAVEALLRGSHVLTAAGLALFVLHWLARITHDYTRRRALVLLVLVVGYCGSALVGGADASQALIGGAVRGVLAAIVVYALLRFDLRTVPAYLAAAFVLQAIEEAVQKGTALGWIACALTTAAAIVSAWFVTRYLERTRVVSERAAASAAAA